MNCSFMKELIFLLSLQIWILHSSYLLVKLQQSDNDEENPMSIKSRLGKGNISFLLAMNCNQ